MAERPATGGFTLLELLIAMVLMGLLSGLLFGGLRLGSRVWAEGDGHLQALEQVQTARNALRRVIAQAVPRRPDQPTTGSILFDGTADRLDFIGLNPAEAAPGVLFWLRLAVERSFDGNRLVLGWRALVPGEEAPQQFDDDETVVVLAGFADLTFSYFGRRRRDRGREARWHDEWTQELELPTLVRIGATFQADDRRPWADLVIAPAIREWRVGQPARTTTDGAGSLAAAQGGQRADHTPWPQRRS